MTDRICARIEDIRREKGRVLVAIDGRCAAGKTTLALRLQEKLGCPLFHMDDFFLRPEQRTQERYDQPGGNVDRERFRDEVLRPLKEGGAIAYRRFDCRTMALEAPTAVQPGEVNLVEGTYSCHPALWEDYDLHIFMTVSPQTQLARLAVRDAKKLSMFQTRWIPLEERYFGAFDLQSRCELVFETG